mmetsp:Transcript_16798/g.31937  ORF Transcript_16798/g.31937 Transcript_16798/m.31937 type:complete len:105 (+) Transcript_16798:333-647(+)
MRKFTLPIHCGRTLILLAFSRHCPGTRDGIAGSDLAVMQPQPSYKRTELLRRSPKGQQARRPRNEKRNKCRDANFLGGEKVLRVGFLYGTRMMEKGCRRGRLWC